MEDEDFEQAFIFKYSYAFGDTGLHLVVNNQMQSVSIGEEKIRFGPIPFQVLCILLWRAGHMVSRDDLLVYLDRADQSSGSSVLSNAVLEIRNRCNKTLPEGYKIPLETHGSFYYFDGEVTAIAQVAEIPDDQPELVVGGHVPSIQGYLTERAYVHAGIEGWHFQPSDGQREAGFARIATSAHGVRKLQREEAILDIIHRRAPDEDISFIAETNLLAHHHKALIWPDGRPHLRASLQGDELAKMAFRDKLALAITLCEKVAKLNAAGIIHGDLKPACILPVARQDFSDFHLAGFAHAYVENEGWEDGLRLDLAFQRRDWHERRPDSENYRAPELLESAEIDERSDAYALGVMLYQVFAEDMERPFNVNWKEDIQCPIIRDIIADATVREPEKRLRSAEDILDHLRGYDALDRARQKTLENEREIARLLEKEERARQRKPYIVALFSLLFISLIALGGLVLQLRAMSIEAREEAAAADAARSLIQTVMTRADPRQSSNGDSQSIDKMLARVSDEIAVRFEGAPDAQIDSYVTIANVHRGRGDLVAERDNLLKAIDIQRGQTSADKERFASNLYAYSNLVSQIGENKGSLLGENYIRSEELIGEADAIFNTIKNPGTRIKAARLYAKATLTTQQGDFRETYESLLPWLTLVQDEGITIGARGFNAVVKFAEAASAIGRPEEGLESLDWLKIYPYKDVPDWIDINRLTALAKIMMRLEDPDTESVLLSTLEQANQIYGGNGLPEANLHHIYGNYLFEQERFSEALDQQNLAKGIHCEGATNGNLCDYFDLFIAFIHIRLDQFDVALPKLLAARQFYEAVFQPGVAQADFALAMTYVGLSEDVLAKEVLARVDLASLEESDPGQGWGLQRDALMLLIESDFPEDDFDAVLMRIERAGLGKDLHEWFVRRGAERA